MRSKNLLWLGLLFVLLLTAFCVAKYIDEFNPNIKTIATPTAEVIDHNLELQPIKIEKDVANLQDNQNNELDEDYLQIIKLVEQEEKDIEAAYNKAVEEEKERKPKQKKVIAKKPIKKHTKIKQVSSHKKSPAKKQKRLLIETIIDNEVLTPYGTLSNYEKRKLKKLAQNMRQNRACFLRIEADRKSRKIYKTKKYLASLGIPSRNIQIVCKRKKQIISINNSDIEISVIKKD